MMFFCDIISILHKSDPSCAAILGLLLVGIMVSDGSDPKPGLGSARGLEGLAFFGGLGRDI